ncbi:hypothetical protein MFRU_045g00380 [Monilinia fructicola]|nr:hypothetical protein MFRU_045g00380 [Monilinia fructicola]
MDQETSDINTPDDHYEHIIHLLEQIIAILAPEDDSSTLDGYSLFTILGFYTPFSLSRGAIKATATMDQGSSDVNTPNDHYDHIIHLLEQIIAILVPEDDNSTLDGYSLSALPGFYTPSSLSKRAIKLTATMDQGSSDVNTPNNHYEHIIHLLEQIIAILVPEDDNEGFVIYDSEDRHAVNLALPTSGLGFEIWNELNDETLSALWSIFEDENESGSEVPTASQIIDDDEHEPGDEMPSANGDTNEGGSEPRAEDEDLLELDGESRLLHLHRHFQPRTMIHNRCLACPTKCPNSHRKCSCRQDFRCRNCISCRDCQVLQSLIVGRISWGCDDQACATAKDRASSQADGVKSFQPGALTIEDFPPLP